MKLKNCFVCKDETEQTACDVFNYILLVPVAQSGTPPRLPALMNQVGTFDQIHSSVV